MEIKHLMFISFLIVFLHSYEQMVEYQSAFHIYAQILSNKVKTL